MLGINATLDVYSREGGSWAPTAKKWDCRVDPVTEKDSLSADMISGAEYKASGPIPDFPINRGDKVVYDDTEYSIVGARKLRITRKPYRLIIGFKQIQ